METKPPAPRAILVGIQVPSVDDVAHAASLDELGRLVKTLGYEVVGTMSQKRDAIDSGTVLGKGRLAELAAITGGTGVVGSMAILQKSKARERFEDADEKKPDALPVEPDPGAPPKPEFVIVDHEISPSQARNLERATGAQVLDRTGVIMEDLPSSCAQPRGEAAGGDRAVEVRLAAPAGVVGGGAAAGLRRGRVRSRSRSPQDPRSPRGAEGATGGYPARQRSA